MLMRERCPKTEFCSKRAFQSRFECTNEDEKVLNKARCMFTSELLAWAWQTWESEGRREELWEKPEAPLGRIQTR